MHQISSARLAGTAPATVKSRVVSTNAAAKPGCACWPSRVLYPLSEPASSPLGTLDGKTGASLLEETRAYVRGGPLRSDVDNVPGAPRLEMDDKLPIPPALQYLTNAIIPTSNLQHSLRVVYGICGIIQIRTVDLSSGIFKSARANDFPHCH
jgi:hypothetical protein